MRHGSSLALTTFMAAFALLAAGGSGHTGAPSADLEAPKRCDSCDEWNAPQEPFRLFGNTYYVGVAGLSSVLVTEDAGHVLLDGGLPQSAALIDASIRKLGFRTEDVRLILSSHVHYDHAGGIAALKQRSGARVAASAASARALEQGDATPDDPQYAFGREANAFPAVRGVETVADGQTLRVGALALTAHLTPGHTPGSTTWTWRSCEGERCLDVVYADSLNAVSADGFRFTAQPGLADAFRRSITRVRELPCDVVVAVHPSFSALQEKLAARAKAPGSDPFVDPAGCRTYADAALGRFEKRMAEEKAGAQP